MKSAKNLLRILFLLAVFTSLLTVGASAKKYCDYVSGDGSQTIRFTVTTDSNRHLTLKLKQTKGTADYSTILSENLTFIDDPKTAKLYGGYTIKVYDSNGDSYATKSWACSYDCDVPLGKNGTFTVEVIPWSIQEVFCEYNSRGWNFLRYNNECNNYDGTWTTLPVWSVKKERGITSCSLPVVVTN